MTHLDLIGMITDLCYNNGLNYDRTPPVQVSPGVFMFNAVEMSDSCKQRGHCRMRSYYAVSKNNKLVLC